MELISMAGMLRSYQRVGDPIGGRPALCFPNYENWLCKSAQEHKSHLAYPRHQLELDLLKAAYDAEKTAYDLIALHQTIISKQIEAERETGFKDERGDSEETLQRRSRLELAVEAATEAKEKLKVYYSHSPEQRISLYEKELCLLEPQVVEALAVENEFIQELLRDPDAARLRLERQLSGGDAQEYSPEQLSRLRELRNAVRAIESKIQHCQWDIAKIRQLASEDKKKQRIESEINLLLPKFDRACVKFAEALAELQTSAQEHEIFLDTRDLKLPRGATFVAGSGNVASRVQINWE